MPRSKELQELFDALGEVEYKELQRINKNLRQKTYADNHKEENRGYYEEHKEEIAEYKKGYYQTPEGIKSKTLANWRTRGITFGEMTDSFFYDVIYLPATQCQSCNKIFNKTTKNDEKQADHKHEPLNPCNIRGVICFACNIKDRWKTRLTEDSIYNQYL